ncbi:hypothetical protein, partial [uncultured Fluviicola sp.]|uniref:hypothetical protein n=1 Tax=uncultured Fluviicola sp. TaxID=463303 RepID=UPI0025D7A7AB
MKTYFILLSCALSFLGRTQHLDSNKDFGYDWSYQNKSVLIDSTNKETETSENQLHFGFSVNQSIAKYGLPTSVLFTINFKKHQFDLGPKFGLGEFAIAYRRVIGAEFNYKFYVLGDTKWYNPYLLFNAGYLNYNTTHTNIYNSQIKDIKNSIELNFGLGIKFTIVRGFYIGTHVGLGTFNAVRQDIIDGEVANKVNEKSGGFLGSVFIGYK